MHKACTFAGKILFLVGSRTCYGFAVVSSPIKSESVTTREHHIEHTLLKCMEEVAAQTGSDLVADLNRHTALHESGLDSLGLAMVLARLDERLGYSPFREGIETQIPGTLSELILLYRHADDEI